MPLKYDQIEEVEAIARRIVKEETVKALSFKVDALRKEFAKTALGPKTKKPKPLTKASAGAPSDGGILVGKQSRK